MGKRQAIIIFLLGVFNLAMSVFAQNWKVNSDYWTATDALGRTTLRQDDVGPKRKNKFVAMFYWTWHTDGIANFSPVMNISEILKANPEAANDANHPAWKGIWGGVFWWDEPLFGYYRTTDEWVLRKHAEMLADAGVDAVFFDCTNGSFTWKSSYMTLLPVWEQARKDGVKTPQIAFMLPFGETEGALLSIQELFRDLYRPALFEDLWFKWKGKPIIMPYPEILNAKRGDTAGMKFEATLPFSAIDVACPSWSNNIGNLTLRLFKWNLFYNVSVVGTPIAEKTFVNFLDNERLDLSFSVQQPGEYLWQLSDATEIVGVWKYNDSVDSATSYFNGQFVAGNYESRIRYGTNAQFSLLTTGTERVPVQLKPATNAALMDSIRNFFTFRPGQPDYVSGPSRHDHWGWLENFPQHGYVGSPSTGFEQVTVGVAQNARVASGGHCYAFNAPATFGRSFTQSQGQDTRPEAYLYGLNFAEQWDRAYILDPGLVFITGWNEWIAGRHENWPPADPYKPFAFPDEYDWERSRDIEPVKAWGDKGDVYYIQLISKIRRFKGMEALDTASAEKTIQIGCGSDWSEVQPQYWHYKGNTLPRHHKGQGDSLFYVNNSGRNDIILAKVARDKKYVYFYVETADNLTPTHDANWMRLFIDIDRDKSTGWQGYDFVVNRTSPADSALVEKSPAGWFWMKAGAAAYAVCGKVLEIKIKRATLEIDKREKLDFEFKWSDNSPDDGNIMDFYTTGDAAPGGRFNFIYSTSKTTTVGENGKINRPFFLAQNYPNPFNPSTNLRYEIANPCLVDLSIYDIAGRKVDVLVNEVQAAGSYEMLWPAKDFSSGLYFASLQSGKNRLIRKMLLIK